MMPWTKLPCMVPRMPKEKQKSQQFKPLDQSQIGCIGKLPSEDQTQAEALRVLREDYPDQTLKSYGLRLLLGNKQRGAVNQEAGGAVEVSKLVGVEVEEAKETAEAVMVEVGK